MQIAAGASFQEFGLSSHGDSFTISNGSQLDASLFRAIIDTSSSNTGVYFHVTGTESFPFVADKSSAAATGFQGFGSVTNGSQKLALEFTDFDPGETFSFRIDVDNQNGWYVSGNSFAGTTLTTMFNRSGSTAELFGAFDARDDLSVWASAHLYGSAAAPDYMNPEPPTFILALIGGTALGGFVWRTRRH